MSVVIETTLGDLTVDLFLSERPRACLNFLKLCKIKYYNFSLFHTISRSFMAQAGDPTGSRSGGESIFGILDGPLKRFFEGENEPRIKHTKMGLISFVGNEERMIGSQFFLTLGEDLSYLDEKHCVFGEVVEGFDILEMINEVICDTDDRPYQDVRITHTVILDDPYPDPKRLLVPSRSPSPSAERLQGGRIAPDEEIDEMEGKPREEIAEIQAAKEAKARATILEMVGDLPDADMAPPENVLFVCKLNPVTSDDDLEIIFSRFGKIKSCEVIRDKKTGDSLQYAFVEFEDQKSCENAYFKMDNVLIDDRRIHVDFSQSVSKIKWHGKGRGVTHYDDKGKKSKDNNNDIGKGIYKSKNHDTYNKRESSREHRSPKRIRDRSGSRDNSKRIRDNSTSPSRDKNRSRQERSKLYKRNDFISLQKTGQRIDIRENRNNRGRNDESSRRTNNSLSPKVSSRSPAPRKNRYVSKSPPRRSRDRSRTPNSKAQDSRKESGTPKRSRDMPPSTGERSGSRNYTENIRKHSERRSRSPNKNNYNETSKYSKTVPSSSRSKQYTPERRSVYERSERSTSKEKNKTKSKNNKSETEVKKKEKTKKKKRKCSSDDSDSDSDRKPKKVKKSSSSSSDSEDYRKKKSKKKKHGKKRGDSSDNEASVNYKRSKSKKKKKKSDFD